MFKKCSKRCAPITWPPINAQKINEREVIIRKYVQISENVEVVRGYSGLSFCDFFALYLVQSEMEVLLDSGRQDLFKKAPNVAPKGK